MAECCFNGCQSGEVIAIRESKKRGTAHFDDHTGGLSSCCRIINGNGSDLSAAGEPHRVQLRCPEKELLSIAVCRSGVILRTVGGGSRSARSNSNGL